MITLNSTILSYNKVKEIEEYKPIQPPESIFMPDEKNNKSFQKFIPDLYDLDKIDFTDKIIHRNLTPNEIRTQNNLKNNFLNSTLMINPEEKKIYNINIYNNNSNQSKNIKKIDFNEDITNKEEVLNNNNIYQNEKHIINNNLINNLKNLKNNNIIDNTNINKKLFIKKTKNINTNEISNNQEYSPIKYEMSVPNLNVNLMNSQEVYNKNKGNNDPKKSDNKSIQSAFITFNYKNIMRKDPNNENSIIINTSFYKRNKHKKSINQTKIDNEMSINSLNSYLKFEEESKENRLSNAKNKNNKNEEILKNFMNSKNDLNTNIYNNTNINNNQLAQSNLNSFNNNSNSNLNIDENDNVANLEDKNNIKCNNLNNYTFRTGNNNIINQPKSSIPSTNNKNLFALNKGKKLKNLNINYNDNPLFDQNNKNKPNVSPFSTKKYNFNSPKGIEENNIINKEEGDDDNKGKSFISNIEKGNLEIEKEKEDKSSIPLVHIKFKNLKKILKKDGLYNVLTFLDCYDLMSLLQTNKSLIFLINKSISNAYYHTIKENLSQFKTDFELLKCSLIYSKVKDSLKIDFAANIRFSKQKYYIKQINDINDINVKPEYYKIQNQDQMSPRCYQIIYCYNFFKSVNPQKKLKTKENTKKVKMYDYYTFDLYSEYDTIPDIYINKEQSLFDINSTDKLVYTQPILPFKINDKGIINFEIYSSNNDFINPSSIKIISKYFDLKNYLNDLKLKEYSNLRICEYENLCFHWKIINREKFNDKIFIDILNKVEQKFKHYFEIKNILFENIGFYVFKIYLVAIRTGRIDSKLINDDFGINIIIKNSGDSIENEIKKNNLLLERKENYEMRLGDTIMMYFTAKNKKKKNNKK